MAPRLRPPCLWALLASLGGAGACTPASALLESEAPGLLLPPYQACLQVVERIEHVDEPSELGFSAIDVLSRLAGETEARLAWLPLEPNDEYTLGYGPEHGSSQLRLRVAAADGPILLRSWGLAEDAPEDTECPPAVLELPVEVSLQSEGLALDESFQARLAASTPERARFEQRLLPGRLAGGLVTELESLDPERVFSLGALILEAELWEGGSRGSLRGDVRATYTQKAVEAARLAFPPPPSPIGEAPTLAVWPVVEGPA